MDEVSPPEEASNLNALKSSGTDLSANNITSSVTPVLRRGEWIT